MKITIEKVTASVESENQYVIKSIMSKIEGLTRIEEAYEEVQKIINPAVFWDCGRGCNHIWVSNFNDERLMLITETRTNK